MEQQGIQVLLFNEIKNQLPQHLSLVDEVADLLEISTDSAYRRIRGDKPVTIEELQKLSANYKISIDQLLQLTNESFIFSGKLANASDHIFEKWMENILQQVQFMNSFSSKHIYFLAKDIPLMQQFLMPELTAFKSFFWRKSILHYDELKGVKFSMNQINPYHIELGRKIIEIYNQVPSTDIWNIESINSTIRQIEFYREANAFQSKDELMNIYASVLKLIDHIERQAELGVKFNLDEKPLMNGAAYNLFNNELILGDNTVLALLDNTKVTFLNHSVINFIHSRNERFGSHVQEVFQNLIQKSTQLSKVGEKERMKFFNRIRTKIRTSAGL